MSNHALVDFLLARIAEDEVVARAASALSRWSVEANDYILKPAEPASWAAVEGYGSGAVERVNGDSDDIGIVAYDEGSPNEREAVHIARHDPARILAECEAKRKVLDALLHEEWFWMVMAVPYSGHPDYDEAWRP